MTATLETVEDEHRLRSCIRDLVAVSGIPAWWLGRPLRDTAESLHHLLVSMLRVDEAYVELRSPSTGQRVVARGGDPDDVIVPRSIWMTDGDGRSRAADDMVDLVRLASFPVGVNGEMGRFTVGSRRSDFPTELETMLMQVIATQLAIALQYASLLARHQQAQEELEESLARAATARVSAERSNRSAMDFLAMMSQALRAPLEAISSYVDLMQLGVHGELSDAQRQDLSRIRHSQEHLLGLIDNVLSFVKMGSGRLHFEITNVPVDETLLAVEALIRPQLEGKQLHYRQQVAGSGVQARADREKLQRVLLNL